MRIKAEQITNSLQGGLQPVYLIYGEETLLVEEAGQQVREAVRAAGANEREVWQVEGRFDWSQIKWQAQTLSLFASHRLVEIRLPSGSPGKEGAEVLRQFTADPPEETTLLIISGKIDSRSQKSKWFTELDAMGVTVPIWPIDYAHLPQWIHQRIRNQGLQVDKRICSLIAEKVEGNLFAAAQEVDKLAMLAVDGEIDTQLVEQSIADNARFEAFGLVDTVFLGQTHKLPRIIERLRAEGTDILSVFSGVSWSVRRMVDMSAQLQDGVPIQKVFASQKPPIWQNKMSLTRQALERHNYQKWRMFLKQMAEIDQAAKGVVKTCPWRLLEKLCIEMAGTQVLSN